MAENNERDNAAPTDQFERITPTAVAPGKPAYGPGRDRGDKTVAALVVLSALLVVCLLGGGLLWWLAGSVSAPEAPAIVDKPEPAPAAKSEPAVEGKPPEQPAAPPPDADQLLAQREAAQSLADTLAEKRGQLTERGVRLWAAAAADEITQHADTGQQLFDQRDFDQAAKAYEQGIAAAEALLQQAPAQLEQALERGQKALAAGDAKAAAGAFDLALAIDSDNAIAQKGAARAANLDAVLAQMRAGRQHEQASELSAARTAFSEARKLDEAYKPAETALARVDAALAQRAFQRHMSDGLAALDRGAFGAARDAFIAARKIRPDASEAGDGLARARAGAERAAIESQRQRAQAAEAQEDWPAAQAAYQAILARDNSLAFAREGQKRAAARAGLAQRLSYHLDHLARLREASVRDDVAEILAEARAIASPGPKLSERIARLDQKLAVASQPVPVRLQSDNRAEVLVYHVGRLGSFDTKQLELTPGEYTAIGRCAGHRDLRREFTVSADGGNAAITIGCGEKL